MIAASFVDKDQVLITINTLEILGIIYLAVALSAMRERIATLEGRLSRNGNGAKQ